jgi:hypothetical protein
VIAPRPHTKPSAFSDQPVIRNRRTRVEEFDEAAGVWRIYRGEVDARPEPAAPPNDRSWRRALLAVLIAAAVVFCLGVRW